ncbi:LysE family transporter, partial [Aggregatibacter aphrophilus]|uniref:LysE family transporter n=1 Tax=Aggregatibacter aphrophilus TaxID=732 RepID=UPI0001AAE396
MYIQSFSTTAFNFGFVHITYSVLRLAAVIASASWLLIAIKIIGGAYLIYFGTHGLRAKMKKEVVEVKVTQGGEVNLLKILWKGFLCNVLNPKAPVYLVSVFTVVLSPFMPLWQLAIYGA